MHHPATAALTRTGADGWAPLGSAEELIAHLKLQLFHPGQAVTDKSMDRQLGALRPGCPVPPGGTRGSQNTLRGTEGDGFSTDTIQSLGSFMI